VTDLNGDRPIGHAAMKAAAAELGVTLKSLRVLDDWADPFTVGTPAQMREARWFLELWERIGFPDGVHLRRIHYRILGEPGPDGGTYQNTKAMWGRLRRAATYCRWLELIDPAAFVDRRNPGAVLNAGPRDDEPVVELPELVDLDDAHEVDAAVSPPAVNGWWTDPKVWTSGEPGEVSLSVTPPGRWDGVEAPALAGYGYATATDQPLVEVWAEKSTMNDVLGPLCQELRVNYVPAAGTQSITSAHLLAERATIARRPVRVLYVSDYDQQGRAMPFAVARHVEYLTHRLDDVGFRLAPLVLTDQQVERYNLPPDPTRDGAVELDALEALAPGALAGIVRAEVEQLRDPTLPGRLAEVEADARRALDAAWGDATGYLTGELDDLQGRIDALVARYHRFGATLDARLQAEVTEATDRHRAMARIVNANVQAEVREVLARYHRQADALNNRLRADLQPLDDRYRTRAERLADRLRRELNALVSERRSMAQALADAVEGFEVELPERPGPVLDDDPLDRWLYASERDWLDQLDVYRRHRKNGSDP
jgi:hypothetical protein